MIVGTSQIDITPEPGGDLTGFGSRTQPSTGVHDPLYCRALYLEEGDERVLWLHADLLGIERSFVDDFRRWAELELSLPPSRVMVSATHTHSGPAVVHLTGCGRYDARYVEQLNRWMREAAVAAMANTENCKPVTVEGLCELAIDRRKTATAHVDPRVGAIGWRRNDDTFKAVVLNYAMHAVCMRDYRISADYPGQTAIALSEQLPGKPMAMVCVGACGNSNPPVVGVDFGQMKNLGRQLAESVTDKLLQAAADEAPAKNAVPTVLTKTVPLPLDVWSVEQINSFADRHLPLANDPDWGKNYRLAIETWRKSMTEHVQSNAADYVDIELFALAIGGIVLLGVNAEIFSVFTEMVRTRTGQKVYTIGLANGVVGYVPTAPAYDEGGYEVDSAFLFYNGFRPKQGGLELLADHASRLVIALLK